MNSILDQWNQCERDDAIAMLLSVCAARRWADMLSSLRPFADIEALLASADEVWGTMKEPDWMEAFRAHPRIGQRTPASATVQSNAWSSKEQSSVNAATQDTLDALARGNAQYEQQFGFTYIVCATGKSADEMLRILERRLESDLSSELREAAEQQRQIMQIRLRKWLQI